MRRKLKGEPGPDNRRPLAIFSNSYDHYGHGDHDIEQGLEHIKVLETKKIKGAIGRKCEAGDYATVHWRAFDMHNDPVEDSRKYEEGQPMTFLMGHYDVPKCWEIALISMHAGESLSMKCPAFYAYGGHERYSHFGSAKIPANSDLVFELDVLNCEETAADLDKANEEDENDAVPLIPKKKKVGKDKKVDDDDDEKPPEESKEIADAKAEVRILKDNVAKQKKLMQKQQEAVDKESADIASSDDDDATAQKKVDALLKKEEKILKEKSIIDKERNSIKKAEDAIK